MYLTEWNFHRNYLVNLVKWFSSLQVLHLLEALFSWYLFFPISCHFSDRRKVPRTACAVVFQKSKFRRGASKQVLLKLQKPIHLSKNRRLGIPLKLWWFFVRVPRVPKMPKKHSGLGIIRKFAQIPGDENVHFPIHEWLIDFWFGSVSKPVNPVKVLDFPPFCIGLLYEFYHFYPSLEVFRMSENGGKPIFP